MAETTAAEAKIPETGAPEAKTPEANAPLETGALEARTPGAPAAKTPLLDVRDLCVTYRSGGKRVRATRNASFSIMPGESIGVVGESGSGKSTMMMAALRLLNPKTTEVSGEVVFDGTSDLLKLSDAEMNRLRWTDIAIVFQKAMNALSPVHRISTQVEDIYRVHEPKATKDEIRERMVELLRLVNLPERVYRLYPHEMSGGMLQRVSIALALLHNPRLLVFDEATTALDVVTQGQILSEVCQLEKELHTTRVMITHDMSVVAASCSKVAVMYAGELMEVGTVREVLKDPKHPYTQGLLDSFPSLRGEVTRLKSIPGFLPDLAGDIPGCAFAPRCPRACERCRLHRPPTCALPGGRSVRCWLYEGGESDGE